jgi:hypothetical protein
MKPLAGPRSTPSVSTSPGANSPAPSAPNAGSRRYRTGEQGRISHLKRGYGLGRTRLKGPEPLAWAGGGLVRDAFLRRERVEGCGRAVDPVACAFAAAPRMMGVHVGR